MKIILEGEHDNKYVLNLICSLKEVIRQATFKGKEYFSLDDHLNRIHFFINKLFTALEEKIKEE
jgi:hypothetical protein